MSNKQRDALKAKLMKGGMTEYFAQQAAEILATEAEAGPGPGAKQYVNDQKKAAEGQRRLNELGAA